MMDHAVLEFVIGFVIGAVVCLGKEFLFQRFILTGNKLLQTLLFWSRLVIDCVVMVAMYFVSVGLFGCIKGAEIVNLTLENAQVTGGSRIGTLVGAALGLSVYMVALVVQTLRKGQ